MTKKSLGQHFLLDARLMQRIVALAGEAAEVNAIEIGPGPGGLTRELLKAGSRVWAVETDARCIPALEELKEAFPDRLTVVHADALTLDLPTLAPAPRRIVSNLPYNISTALTARWLADLRAHGPRTYESLTLMFQKEVAQRLMAPPGGKDYGRLSVIAQWLCDIEDGFDIPPGAFLPPPKVTSSVICLRPKQTLEAAPPFAAVEAVSKAAFGQRRKMLRSALKTLTPDAEALLKDAGIDPAKRAEQLEIRDFLKLAMRVAS